MYWHQAGCTDSYLSTVIEFYVSFIFFKIHFYLGAFKRITELILLENNLSVKIYTVNLAQKVRYTESTLQYFFVKMPIFSAPIVYFSLTSLKYFGWLSYPHGVEVYSSITDFCWYGTWRFSEWGLANFFPHYVKSWGEKW